MEIANQSNLVKRKRTVEAGAQATILRKRRALGDVVYFRPLVFGQPLLNTPYVIDDGDVEIQGNTGLLGLVNYALLGNEELMPEPPDVLYVRVGQPPLVLNYVLDLQGNVAPFANAAAPIRLTNLGYLQPNQPLHNLALATFQHHYGLAVSGVPTEETQQTLKAIHGS